MLQNLELLVAVSYPRPSNAMPVAYEPDALKKQFLRGNLLHLLGPQVYLEGDASVVHRVLYLSVPLLVDSSGRGGLTFC